jgi:hypothetical protein
MAKAARPDPSADAGGVPEKIEKMTINAARYSGASAR